jgi:DNA invertase Pin-like site-specific DNA recombinase
MANVSDFARQERPMIIGYARTSTLEQEAGLEAQLRVLAAAGVERTYQEQVSSVAERPQLAAALDYLRKCDALVVTKLDRLARSVADLLRIVQAIEGKGAALRVLNLNLDTGTPTGRLMLTMLGAIAQFEREMMLERQREGIAKAKAAGKYKGRAPTARVKAAEIAALRQQGLGAAEIARRVKISRASVYRCLGRQHRP